MALTGMLRIAGPYNQALIDEITTSFEKKLGSKVKLTVKQDDSLIGGFVAQIDGKIYDASVKTKLAGLKASLIQR